MKHYESSLRGGKSFRLRPSFADQLRGGDHPESSPKHPPFSSQPRGHDGFRAWATQAPFRGCVWDSRRDVFLENRDPDDAHDACCRGSGVACVTTAQRVAPQNSNKSPQFKPVVHGNPDDAYDAWCRGGEWGEGRRQRQVKKKYRPSPSFSAQLACGL